MAKKVSSIADLDRAILSFRVTPKQQQLTIKLFVLGCQKVILLLAFHHKLLCIIRASFALTVSCLLTWVKLLSVSCLLWIADLHDLSKHDRNGVFYQLEFDAVLQWLVNNLDISSRNVGTVVEQVWVRDHFGIVASNGPPDIWPWSPKASSSLMFTVSKELGPKIDAWFHPTTY